MLLKIKWSIGEPMNLASAGLYFARNPGSIGAICSAIFPLWTALDVSTASARSFSTGLASSVAFHSPSFDS